MSDLIRWNPSVDRFDANPAATVALDRAAWEQHGALFAERDDGDDERVGLAVGEIVTPRGPFHFGVLDYGEDTTFVLVPGRDRAAVDAAIVVLRALQEAGVVDLATQLADFSAGGGSSLSHVALEDRMDQLEREVAKVTGLLIGPATAYPAAAPLLIMGASEAGGRHVATVAPGYIEGQLPLLERIGDDDERARRGSHIAGWQGLLDLFSSTSKERSVDADAIEQVLGLTSDD
jgi:hypothetical protein